MGRRTWESLPRRPLPGRLNVIVSRTMAADSSPTTDVRVFPSLPAAIAYCNAYRKFFICGGEAMYREAFPLADKIELTLIHKRYEGDAFFPEIDPALWAKTNTADFDTFSFISYAKKIIIPEQIKQELI
jgi:dihydrofolate reductase